LTPRESPSTSAFISEIIENQTRHRPTTTLLLFDGGAETLFAEVNDDTLPWDGP
jgi:hypothetical protein